MFAGGELSPKAPTEGACEGGTAPGKRRLGGAAWERRPPRRRWQACVPLADGTLLRTRVMMAASPRRAAPAAARGNTAADMPRRIRLALAGAVVSAGLLQCGEAEGSHQDSRVREYISRYCCCSVVVAVAHRWSRLVLFRSSLFYETDALAFRPDCTPSPGTTSNQPTTPSRMLAGDSTLCCATVTEALAQKERETRLLINLVVVAV